MIVTQESAATSFQDSKYIWAIPVGHESDSGPLPVAAVLRQPASQPAPLLSVDALADAKTYSHDAAVRHKTHLKMERT